MADSGQSTPRRGRSAAASSFETAASTPSSLIETSSPGGEDKIKDKNGSKNKKKSKKKSKEIASTHDFSSITAEDLVEAGTSGTASGPGNRKTAEAPEDVPMEESGSSDCEIVETGTIISGTSEISKTRRGKRRRTEVEGDSEESLTDMEVKQTIGENSMDSMTALSASTVAARAFE